MQRLAPLLLLTKTRTGAWHWKHGLTGERGHGWGWGRFWPRGQRFPRGGFSPTADFRTDGQLRHSGLASLAFASLYSTLRPARLPRGHLRERCHRCLVPPLPRRLRLGGKRSEPASGRPAPASPILLQGAGPDKAAVPTPRVSRMPFSQQNYAGSLRA